MLFYNIQAKADDVKEFDIDILKLQSELRMLQQYVNDLVLCQDLAQNKMRSSAS